MEGGIHEEAAVQEKKGREEMRRGRLSEVVEGIGHGGHLNLPALDDGITVTLPLPVCAVGG